MSELKGACIFGQSGGPTSVINASAYGVIATALKNPSITRVLGAEHGIKGVLNDRLFDMGQEDPAELELSLIHIWWSQRNRCRRPTAAPPGSPGCTCLLYTSRMVRLPPPPGYGPPLQPRRSLPLY